MALVQILVLCFAVFVFEKNIFLLSAGHYNGHHPTRGGRQQIRRVVAHHQSHLANSQQHWQRRRQLAINEQLSFISIFLLAIDDKM